MNSTQLSTQKANTSPTAALQSMLNAPSVTAQFQKALGKHGDSFCASLVELVTSDRNLQACPPKLLVAEALKAATMHLPLNKALSLAYLVPFKDWKTKQSIPTLVVSYRGLINLATRTQQYKIINADVVYEGELVGKNKVTGEIDLSGEKVSDHVVGFFAFFRLVNGLERTLYMSNEDMAKYAKRYSKGLKRDITVEQLMALADQEPTGIGWMGDYVNMGKKTVIRQILKYGPISVEMEQAIAQSDEADNGLSSERESNISQYNAAEEIDDAEIVGAVDTATGEEKNETEESAPTDEPDF